MSSRIDPGPDYRRKKSRPKKERKFLTWFDINRILKNMDSPSIGDNFTRADIVREYYACVSSYLRMVAHFSKIAREFPWVLIRRPRAETQAYLEAVGEAGAEVADLTAAIIVDTGA